jgi:hypothetical protein
LRRLETSNGISHALSALIIRSEITPKRKAITRSQSAASVP